MGIFWLAIQLCHSGGPRVHSKITFLGGGSNGWAYFGLLYNFATVREVAIFLRVGIFYLRTKPTLNYTVDRYDCH